jgi:hypothetical protein
MVAWHQGRLGADFVVDTRGIVRLAYRSRDPTDGPSVEHILAVLGQLVVRPRGF